MEPMGIERHRWASREAEVSGRERVNTDSSGSGRVDDIKGHAQGEIRGATKLVKSLKRLFSAAPEGTAARFFIVSRLLPAALDRYLRGFTGHVARPSRSIETRSFPSLARRYLATLPSMSLTPVAPFRSSRRSACARDRYRGNRCLAKLIAE